MYMGLSWECRAGLSLGESTWNPQEIRVKASTLSIIRGELRDVLTGLVEPEHPWVLPRHISGREMMWQSTSTGAGAAFMASAWGLGRAWHHSITFVPCANSEAPGRHLAQATLSQSDRNRRRSGSDTQQRCSRVMSPKAGTVIIH